MAGPTGWLPSGWNGAGLSYNPNNTSPVDQAVAGVDAGAPSVPASYGGVGDGVKTQMHAWYWVKKAIVQARKDQFFMPLASTIGMPKNFGKEIRIYEYVPLLDDRNQNSMGLDANGAQITATYKVTFPPNMVGPQGSTLGKIMPGGVGPITAGVGAGTNTAAQDATAAVAALNAIKSGLAVVDGTTNALVHILVNTLDGLTAAQVATFQLYFLDANVFYGEYAGNLYGSSRDIGTISSKLPLLTENGGRANRVGFTRLQRSGTLTKFGFFYEFNKESMDFDSDAELYERLSTELVNGAVQLTEAVLQRDLLNSAGVVLYSGSASSKATMTGEGAAPSVVSYNNLIRMSQILGDNRCPKQTKVITGSRMIDTKTIQAARVMFVGNEILPHLKRMTDSFGNPAFINVAHYGDAVGELLNGEIGAIDEFRIVLVPEMLHWEGAGAGFAQSFWSSSGTPGSSGGVPYGDGGSGNSAGYNADMYAAQAVGATVSTNAGTEDIAGVDVDPSDPPFRATNGYYDVFPMLVVGDDSFTTIGFQTDGKAAKFTIITKMPGDETATRDDPYGETGFSSIKWYYGILIKRPERLGLILTLAPV